MGRNARLIALAACITAIGCNKKKTAEPPPVVALADAAPRAASPPADAGAPDPEPVTALRLGVDCNASAWPDSTSRRPTAAPPLWLDQATARIDANEANYQFVNRRPDTPDPTKVVCWHQTEALAKHTRPGQPGTVQMLFCSFDGKTYPLDVTDVGSADVMRSDKPPGSCYAACGAGCNGVCQDIAVGCAPPAAGSNTSAAFVCLALVDPPNKDPQFPWFKTAPAPRCVDPKRHANRNAAACTATVNRYAPDGLVAVAGSVKVCSAAECCGHHDECTGAHRNPFKAAFWKCHAYGDRKCGGTWAAAGRPDDTDWTLRVYNKAGQPITSRGTWHGDGIHVGECAWSNGQPSWKPPPAQMESYTCAVDGIEH